MMSKCGGHLWMPHLQQAFTRECYRALGSSPEAFYHRSLDVQNSSVKELPSSFPEGAVFPVHTLTGRIVIPKAHMMKC